MERKKTAFGVVRSVLIILFSIIFIASAVMLVLNLTAKHKGARMYGELERTFYSSGFTHKKLAHTLTFREDNGGVIENSITHGENDEAQDSQAESLRQIREGLAALGEINSDIYGWIFVENTDINYPIVRGGDNEFYLDHAYDGKPSPLGAIFADCRCGDSISDNRNTVLYGHNLLSGESDMFHDVEMFFERDFFESTYIYIYTFDGIYVYEPFSIYQARYDYNYFEVLFDSDSEFDEFVSRAKENSRIESDVAFSEGDSMITLSTCTNIEYFTRYALHAKLIYLIED